MRREENIQSVLKRQKTFITMLTQNNNIVIFKVFQYLFLLKVLHNAHFGRTCTTLDHFQRLTGPLCKNDMQILESFYAFAFSNISATCMCKS